MSRFKVGDWVWPTLETLEYAEDEESDYPPEIHNGPFQIVKVTEGAAEQVYDGVTYDYSLYHFGDLSIALYDFEVEASS